MPAIQLADPLYEQLRTRAAEAGFASVDEYVAAMLGDDPDDRTFDNLFTPERIAELDRIVANMDHGGRLFTQEEVDAHFKARREVVI